MKNMVRLCPSTGNKNLVWLMQASREDDPHSPSVQDRTQANHAEGRFQTGEIVLLTRAKPHPAH